MILDKWLRRLWTINGIFLLVFMGLLSWALISEQLHKGDYDEVLPVALADSLSGSLQDTPRAIRYGRPQSILGTTTQMIRVRYGEAQLAEGLGLRGYSPASPLQNQPIVNLIFVGDDLLPRLLLNQPAFIKSIHAPSARGDSTQTWISYEIATVDTDGNGSLDQRDRTQVYVTDLNGRGLRRLLPLPMRVTWHGRSGQPNKILILVLADDSTGLRADAESLPQRAYLYDVLTETTTQFEALDEVVQRAGSLLAN